MVDIKGRPYIYFPGHQTPNKYRMLHRKVSGGANDWSVFKDAHGQFYVATIELMNVLPVIYVLDHFCETEPGGPIPQPKKLGETEKEGNEDVAEETSDDDLDIDCAEETSLAFGASEVTFFEGKV